MFENKNKIINSIFWNGVIWTTFSERFINTVFLLRLYQKEKRAVVELGMCPF